MRLMVPASTLDDAKKLIEAGADDIYLGAASKMFHQYSFNGRSVTSKNGKRVLPDFEEIHEICSYLHMHNGNVYFLANIPIVNGNDDTFRKEFLKYVREGIAVGADYIILGNLSTLTWVREEFESMKTVASSYLEVQNELTLKMLEELGVSQIVLSYQCSLDEIRDLCRISHAQIEVFGHGGCSFYVGTCNLFHEMGESVRIGYPCRALYDVKYNNEECGRSRILDCFKMCSLCRLKELASYGVHSLKVVGRDLDAGYILDIVKVYSKVLHKYNNGENNDLNLLDVPKWWRKTWCSSGRLCRYGGSLF